MANEGAKKRVIKNAAFLKKTQLLVGITNAVYLLFRAFYLWGSFSMYHIAAFAMTSVVYLASYSILSSAARPKYAPLAQGGGLIDGGMHDLGEDITKGGMVEYTWDMILVTAFVQLATGLLTDWFWLVYLVPPSIGMYYLWIKVIYPWISKPDAERQTPQEMMQQQKGKKAKYSKVR